ncbi:MAG: response regulator [Myxococcales bacterium]|nr:response regulator [Myxococcales bacterium]
MSERVLIVDDDPQLLDTLTRKVRTWGFDVTEAASAEGALRELGNGDFNVMVTDLRLGGVDGIDLIREARSVSPRTHTVLMSAYATARDHQLATDNGTVRVLCKPFTPSELRTAIGDAIESRTSFRGTLSGLSLVDVLQMLHLSRRTTSIVLSGDAPGSLHFSDGELVHAECRQQVGTEALGVLLSAPSGTMATRPFDPATPATIAIPFQALIMDTLRAIDEAGKKPSMLPPGMDDSSPLFDLCFEADSRTAKLELLCSRIVVETPGSQCCAVVDLGSSQVLAAYGAKGVEVEFDDEFPRWIRRLFRGQFVAKISDELARIRESEPDHPPQLKEIVIHTANTRVFLRAVGATSAVLALVCNPETQQGFGAASLRIADPEVAALLC